MQQPPGTTGFSFPKREQLKAERRYSREGGKSGGEEKEGDRKRERGGGERENDGGRERERKRRDALLYSASTCPVQFIWAATATRAGIREEENTSSWNDPLPLPWSPVFSSQCFVEEIRRVTSREMIMRCGPCRVESNSVGRSACLNVPQCCSLVSEAEAAA